MRLLCVRRLAPLLVLGLGASVTLAADPPALLGDTHREALERIPLAAGDLDARIADLEGQDQRLQGLAARVREQLAALREAGDSGRGQAADDEAAPAPRLASPRSAAG